MPEFSASPSRDERLVDPAADEKTSSASPRAGTPCGTLREAWSAVKNSIWSDKHDLTTPERVVLEALVHFADAGGETFVSVSRIAERTRLSEGTIRRSLTRL